MPPVSETSPEPLPAPSIPEARPRTVLHALEHNAAHFGEGPALWGKHKTSYLPTSWEDYARKVRHAALGLEGLGFGKGDILGILSFNREEWLVMSLAAMALGGAGLGLYLSQSSEQLAYILEHSRTKVIVVEDAAGLARVLPLKNKKTLPALEKVIVIEGATERPRGVLAYDELLARGQKQPPERYAAALAALEPSQLGALIYTSGTTGQPKGVMLTHENLTWTSHQLGEMTRVGTEDVVLSYLPLSHIAEQVISLHLAVILRYQVYFAEAADSLARNLPEVRPTFLFGVPRVFEKLKAAVEQGIAGLTGMEKTLVTRALKTAHDRNTLTLAKKRVPTLTELGYLAAQKGPLLTLKKKLGLDRAWLLMSGAAPIGLEVLELFASLDLVIREVYGQSEGTGPTTLNAVKSTRLGTVGRPLLGVELRIAEDGEVLLRGKSVSPGYYRDEAGTAELLEDGWMHSGDLGELDGDGFLTLTGRKKELLVTSNGKKTSPSALETRLTAIAPLGHAVVFGDGKKHLVALLTLDPDRVPAFSREHGFPADLSALASHAGFQTYLQREVEQQVNARVSRFETIKRFAVLPRDLSIEAGELTPTLKVRRSAVETLHRAVLESLYL